VVENSTSSSLSLVSTKLPALSTKFIEVVAFSLNNFQSSSLAFFRASGQGATLPFFTIRCSLALVVPPFVIFPQ